MSEPRTEAGKWLLRPSRTPHRHCWLDGTGVCIECGTTKAFLPVERGIQMGRPTLAEILAIEAEAATPPALDRETIRSALKGARGLAFDEGETDLDAELKRAIDLLDGLP